jgi:capsular polysaccharide export protein
MIQALSIPEKTKSFLFLQGPHSQFFQLLADELESHGHQCHRINLCFSDWLFWRRPGANNYRGLLEWWSGYLREFLSEHGITDIILMGEQRDYHRIAVKLAQESGIRVTVTEWGYLRPDWITFERNGMSGNTDFPKHREEILRLAEACGEPDFSRRFRDSFARLALQGFVGDVGNWIFGFLYPGYRNHLLENPLLLYLSTGLKKLATRLHRKEAENIISDLVSNAARSPFFIFPLQIEADFQIRAYSKYANLVDAIEEVVRSFARHASYDHRLVIKLHPMDPGFRPWLRIISRIARREGVVSRVFFLDGGSFEDFVDKCRGVVTINSTAGVSALRTGRRVMALGESVYGIKGLTFQGRLDEFWNNAAPPDPALCTAFIRALAGCIQIKGGFFSREGMENAAQVAAFRLSKQMINNPLGANCMKETSPRHERREGVSSSENESVNLAYPVLDKR